MINEAAQHTHRNLKCSKYYLFIIFCLLSLCGCQKEMHPIHFDSLKLPASPNYALIAPEGFKPKPFMVALKFNAPEKVSAKIIVEDIKSRPRIQVLEEDWIRLHFRFIQRTSVFRFPDYIDLKFVELTQESSSYILYSRSKYGYYDFGTNERRLSSWQKDWETIE